MIRQEPPATAPMYRALEQHSGEVSAYFEALRGANDNLRLVAELRAMIADQAAEIAGLGEKVRALGSVNSELASGLADYLLERNEARDALGEAEATVEGLTARLAELEREVTW